MRFNSEMHAVKNICDSSIKILKQSDNTLVKQVVADFDTFLSEFNKETKLKIAFIGQYSAGKSSLIAAMVGGVFIRKEYVNINNNKALIEVYKVGDKEINIGAQIITDKPQSYDWENIILVDTPGLHAAVPSHDEITKDLISKADILVYVVPNELFNPQSGEFFRELTFTKHRSGSLLLVINKMSREINSHTTLLNSISAVTEPNTPSDFYTTFLDAQSFLKSQTETDPDEKDYCLKEANFQEFLNNLDALVKLNNLYNRLRTPLNMILDGMEKALNILSVKDELSKDILELLRRKNLILRASKTRLKNKLYYTLHELEHSIRTLANKITVKIDGQHSLEAINSAIDSVKDEIEQKVYTVMNEIQATIDDEFETLSNELSELSNSSLSASVLSQIKLNQNVNSSANNLSGLNIGHPNKQNILLDSLPAASEIFSKMGNFTSKVSRDMVYDVVKFFGGKFKPWGAVNAAKFINKAAPFLAGIGTIFEIYSNIKEKNQKIDAETKLREARTSIRDEFSSIASAIRDSIWDGYKDNSGEFQEGLYKAIFSSVYDFEFESIKKDENSIRTKDNENEAICLKIKNQIEFIHNKIVYYSNIS